MKKIIGQYKNFLFPAQYGLSWDNQQQHKEEDKEDVRINQECTDTYKNRCTKEVVDVVVVTRITLRQQRKKEVLSFLL
jgi:ribosomal protein S25